MGVSNPTAPMAPAVQAFVSITLGPVVGKIVAAGLGSFASTVVAGGSLESAFQNGIIGVVSAGLAGSIGHGGIANKITNTFASSFGRGAATFIAHGVAQGSTSWLSGGKFRDGFIGAIVGHASGYAMAGLGLGAPGTGGLMATVTRTLVAASAGGIAASLTGGNFANGAISAAFTHLFNGESIKAGTKPLPDSGDSQMLSGSRGLFKDLFRYALHRDSLNGRYGDFIQEDALQAQFAIDGALQAYSNDLHVPVNGQMHSFRSEVHGAAIEFASENPMFLAGRLGTQGVINTMVTRYTGGYVGLVVGGNMFGSASYGAALNAYDNNARGAALISSGINGSRF